MLIKNTDGSHCKIKNIKISGLKAYVTLIIYSVTPQTTPDILGNIHRVFSFYLRDKNSDELFKLSHNNYWIDRNNNYNNDSNNIDINMNKEIILEIDITNNNQSNMKENRWVRQCNIVLMDHTSTLTEAWVSEDLTLISKEINLPKISRLKVNYHKDKIITIDFDYTYESQNDFNYINSNLITSIELRSPHNNSLLESLDIPHEFNSNTQTNSIYFCSMNTYTGPVIYSINIKNLQGDVLYNLTQLFNPEASNIKLMIKEANHNKVKCITVKDIELQNVIAIKNK